MNKPILKSLLLSSVLIVGGISQAATVGMNMSPLGDRSDPNIKYAYWDQFTQTQVNPPGGTTYTFNGVSNLTSTLTGLSLTQTSAHVLGSQGSGLLSPDVNGVADAYYSSTQPQSWVLNATSSVNIKMMSFQIKTANISQSVVNQLYVPTLNGITAGTYYTNTAAGDTMSGFASYVIEYRWDNLNIAAGTPLTLTFAMAGGSSGNFTRKPVDFIALDVAVVPEPKTPLLLGLGAALSLCGIRRRRSLF